MTMSPEFERLPAIGAFGLPRPQDVLPIRIVPGSLEEPVATGAAPQPDGGGETATMPVKGHRGGITFRRVAAAVATVAVLGLGAESIPGTGLPEHTQVALTEDIAVADAHALLADGLQNALKLGASAIGKTYTPPSPPLTVDGMNGAFHVPGTHNLYKSYLSPISWYAPVWSVTRAETAMYVGGLLTGNEQARQRLERVEESTLDTYQGHVPEIGQEGVYQGPVAFRQVNEATPLTDDPGWQAVLELMAYKKTNNPAQLAFAKDIFALAVSQWDADGGGVYWQVQLTSATNHTRATVSNVLAAWLGAEIYHVTGDRSYLKKSEQIFDWVQERLAGPSGTYFDHVNPDGSVSPWIFTYTPGVGGAVGWLLSQEDPSHYSSKAQVKRLENAISYFNQHHTWGNPAFDSIFGQFVMYVAGQSKDPALAKAVAQGMRAAVAAAPAKPDNLLDFAGEVTERELERLPQGKWSQLLS